MIQCNRVCMTLVNQQQCSSYQTTYSSLIFQILPAAYSSLLNIVNNRCWLLDCRHPQSKSTVIINPPTTTTTMSVHVRTLSPAPWKDCTSEKHVNQLKIRQLSALFLTERWTWTYLLQHEAARTFPLLWSLSENVVHLMGKMMNDELRSHWSDFWVIPWL